jgi:hypothetical protein
MDGGIDPTKLRVAFRGFAKAPDKCQRVQLTFLRFLSSVLLRSVEWYILDTDVSKDLSLFIVTDNY